MLTWKFLIGLDYYNRPCLLLGLTLFCPGYFGLREQQKDIVFVGNYPTPNLEDLNHTNTRTNTEQQEHRFVHEVRSQMTYVLGAPIKSSLHYLKKITPSISPYNEIHTPEYINLTTSLTLEEKIC